MRWNVTCCLAVAGMLAGLAAPAAAAPVCQNTGSFDRWMAEFRQEAAAAGISRGTISAALDGITLDPGIIGGRTGQPIGARRPVDFPPLGLHFRAASVDHQIGRCAVKIVARRGDWARRGGREFQPQFLQQVFGRISCAVSTKVAQQPLAMLLEYLL